MLHDCDEQLLSGMHYQVIQQVEPHGQARGTTLGFADSLRERRGLVVRHPDYRRIHPRLKTWLSAVGVNFRLAIFVNNDYYQARIDLIYKLWLLSNTRLATIRLRNEASAIFIFKIQLMRRRVRSCKR